MTDLGGRARGCLLGLAAGDALGRPAENLTPQAIAARWGVLRELEPLPDGRPAGTDDTEYSVFVSLLLERHGAALTPADVYAAWRADVAGVSGPLRGAGFSELGTVQAIRRGLVPPATGQHHHGWSDGLAMRAAPYGVFAAGDPAEAARLSEVDGTVAHSGEGILGGRAVAAGVAAAMTGARPTSVVESALSVVPADSWTARALRRAIAAVATDPGDRLADVLYDAVVPRHYPWADLAPEAVALAYAAYLVADGDVEGSVVTAANLGRDADTTAAIAGALAGAGAGESAVPARWAEAIGPLRGSCLPSVAGLDVRDVADRLVAARTRSIPATAPVSASVAASPASGAGPTSTVAVGADPVGGTGPGDSAPGTDASARGTGSVGTTAFARSAAQSTSDHVGADSRRRDDGPVGAASSRAVAPSTSDRVRGAFVGLAIGDATGWPASRHRFGLLAPWTRRLARELDAYAEEHAVTTLPVPFALNQPTGPLAVGPSDDAEWLAYAADTVGVDRAAAYRKLVGRTDLRARISVRTALDNLAAGLAPPVSGHDNPHHFDDAAAVRAVAFGARYAGDPVAAATAAQADAEVTNALDGVAGARAMAAGVSVALTGDLAGLPGAVLAELPAGTAIRRTAERALSIVDGREPFEALADLAEAVADHVYSYGVAAADTVPLALALTVAAGGRFAAALGAAATLPSYAESVPALTGALCGAYAGFAALPAGWRERCRTLAGCCLPEYAGTDLVAVADRLSTQGGT